MSNRTTTGITTIPLGTTGAGTVTADTTDAKYLVGTGTNFLSLVETSKASRTPTNYWIFIASVNELRRIVGIISDELLLLDTATTATADAYSILLADLKGWTVENVGMAAGTVGSGAIAAGAKISSGEYFGGENFSYSQPTWLNGSGTTLQINEFDKQP